ncbi:unnamed protein product [Miscanthus lutarioriparius]|uniref:RING-type domain-containing protein n=1 Tax=Miscanthus lutarioriparius TaxID=422564 RepID=A0A811N9R4_9POAL|nr:unnamed protein product [Miscanthus lutarioriparius]
MLACLRPDLFDVAKVLIELGANVNAYRSGSHCGTALHHAAKKGLQQTVHLLLSHRANPFIPNDDCNTALELAREKGHVNVVRAIEGRLSLFCGWMRENYAPAFLDAIAPQFMTRKIWAVILPREVRTPTRPLKLELAIYPELQASKPRAVLKLWKCQIEQPKLNQADPSIIIFDKGTKTRYKILPAYEGDKQQLQWFYNACCGMAQVFNTAPVPPANLPMPDPAPAISSVAPSELSAPSKEDVELAMAINASIQSAIAEGVPNVQPNASTPNNNVWGIPPRNSHNGWGPPVTPAPSKTSGQSQARVDAPSSSTYNGWDVPGTSSKPHKTETNPPVLIPQEALQALPTPTAPPFAEETFYNGPVHYPSIDSTPVDVTMPATTGGGTAASITAAPPKQKGNEADASDSGKTSSSTCVICLDAPVEGACIPCGHMAGCMSCLKDIESKKWGCPICRATINQVVRLYAV